MEKFQQSFREVVQKKEEKRDNSSTFREQLDSMPAKPSFAITWKKVATAFSSPLLIAIVTYSQQDTPQHARKETIVLGKVFEECVDEPFCRFIFWLTTDYKIDRTNLDADTRDAIRAELAMTVKPLTALQTSQMNVRLNLLPDYLRAFYLEDYFDSMIKGK
jgi:hypothetical protein